MSSGTWQNDDGLYVRYGTAQGNRSTGGATRAGATTGAGKERELVLHFDLEGAARTTFTADLDNDGTLDGFSGLDTPLPAGVLPTSVEVLVTETAAGGTNYEIGTYQIDGTIIDIDGIINENTGAEAGDDFALIGAVTTQDQYIAAKTTGTYTAGKVTVIIRYTTV